MKLSEILKYDMRKADGHDVLQAALKKMKPFEHCEGDVPLESIEKFLWKATRKYDVKYGYLTFANTNCEYPEEEDVYRMYFIEKGFPHQWVICVIGLTLYETFAKGAIALYSFIKSRQQKQES